MNHRFPRVSAVRHIVVSLCVDRWAYRLCPAGRFGGYDYTTVHEPCVEYGSGFRYEEGLPLAPRWMEGCCKGRPPEWAVNCKVKKYRSVEAFLKRNPHLKEFK